MTAEIAVMNRRGVALAADSAVTYKHEGAEDFSSADKISLSKHEPVAVMVYGGADINDVPWETAIKMYREALGSGATALSASTRIDFLSFLGRHSGLFSDAQKRIPPSARP